MELNRTHVRRDVLVIGASAGGFDPLLEILGALLPRHALTVAVVIHRGAFGPPSLLAEILEQRLGVRAVEPVEREHTTGGVVYIAPRDMHLVFDDGDVVAHRGAKQHYTRPAVDPLFVSAARWHGPRVVGVLLSGGGGDGVLGLTRIKAAGGISLVQSPREAEHPSMPVTAVREDHVDAALPLSDLVRVIGALAHGEEVHVARRPP